MGSNYYGETKLGNERGGGGGSRKGKKNNSDHKPKQPQRGLGVAQLEKLRLHGQLPTSSSTTYLPYDYPSTFNQEDMGLQTGYHPSHVPSASFSYSSSSTSSMVSSASYGFHPNIMVGIGDYDRANIRYGDSHPSTAVSWNQGNSLLEAQQFAQSTGTSTRALLNLQVEGTQAKRTKSSSNSTSQNSESSDSHEVDLELRLSI